MSDWKDPAELPALPANFRRFAKKLNELDDLEESVTDALKTEVRTRAIVFGGAALPQTQRLDVGPALEAGVRAVEKCAADPSAILGPEEEAGLEAVVRLRERPALLVQKDSFPLPPDRWRHLNKEFRQDVSARLPSAGRIDARPGEMVGTGFVVAEDLIMTNRHVVELFADQPPDETGPWAIRANARPTIDFKFEHGEEAVRRFTVLDVVGVHPKLDIALLRVAKEAQEPAGAKLPAPMKLAAQPPAIGGLLELYAIGYPWTDNENATPPEVIEAIYGNVFQVKRLQPGEFNSMFEAYAAFSHDCSTLGGNSGSCIVDLRLDQTIGLHFKGKYRQANYAVALWLLKDDPLFKARGVNY